jgi:gamma-glutamyltranspeptidase / glutathione hydrolase / leukotriene-C4 hydrolase
MKKTNSLYLFFDRDVLMEGGNAVDGAIATLFCDGVACPQSMGLGGGFVMTIYNKPTGEVHTINAREHAPGAAFEDMFDGNSTMAQKGKCFDFFY